MNEVELNQCLRQHPVTRCCFRGVFARDELTVLLPGDLCIINTDQRQDPGTHWVLCYGSTPPLYFDSYGLPATYPEIEALLGEPYLYNAVRLQGDRTNVCGHYVAFVSIHLCRGMTMQDIRKKYFTRLNNDRKIVSLFRNEFGYPRRRRPYKDHTLPMSCQCLCDHVCE